MWEFGRGAERTDNSQGGNSNAAFAITADPRKLSGWQALERKVRFPRRNFVRSTLKWCAVGPMAVWKSQVQARGKL
jgi:hypothetical protein